MKKISGRNSPKLNNVPMSERSQTGPKYESIVHAKPNYLDEDGMRIPSDHYISDEHSNEDLAVVDPKFRKRFIQRKSIHHEKPAG